MSIQKYVVVEKGPHAILEFVVLNKTNSHDINLPLIVNFNQLSILF